MPDWSYHLIFKPVLKQVAPYYSREFIHRGMNRIASLPGGRHIINFLGREESSALLQKEIEHISFPNSIGLSGKLDPLLSGTKAFTNLGFGCLEIGPVTLHERVGELPEVDEKQQVIHFPNVAEAIGLQKTIDKLKRLPKKQPILVRLAGDRDEQLEMITRLEAELAPLIDAYILDGIAFRDSLQELSAVHRITKKLLLLSFDVEAIAELDIETLPAYITGIVIDDLSDRTAANHLKRLLQAVSSLREKGFIKKIVTVGGVLEPADALQLIEAQVDIVMLSGGYVFAGPGLPKRIKEAQLLKMADSDRLYSGWGWYFLFGLAIMLGGMLAWWISLTSVILSYDEYFLGMSREAILAYNERILFFMAHDRMTLAGTMISGGIIYMCLAWHGVRKGLLWAKQATDLAAIIGFLGIFLFIGYGYFDWLHLLFWLVLAPFYIAGFLKTRSLKGAPSSSNLRNSRLWKRGLYGQLSFVMLGFSFVLGGIVISFIGVTNVFVATDISYICLPPEMLQEFNERLIPVIAHDRAGFGSALLSVGLLVLSLSLWAFHQGKRWVWWTLCVGGIPAFASGIGIHFAIGYTDFVHLLPAYFAFLLYGLGLIFSYRFFHSKSS